ncbi:MAG TPA: cadherin domain-containing protein [Steroidobacteraceae bacterium]|nr:cadherin domain-containing protein [Steroidobacteraceae bacterium]
MAPPVKTTDTPSWTSVRSNFARLASGNECTPGTATRIGNALAYHDFFAAQGLDMIGRVTYSAQALPTPTGSYALPTIALVDYSAQQLNLIGGFMDILGQKLETDPNFQNLRAMQILRANGSEGYALLNSPTYISAKPADGVKGATIGLPHGDGTGTVVTVTEALDLTLNNSWDKLRLLDRVAHELLHKDKSLKHYVQGYDPNKGTDLGSTILANLTDKITPTEARALDSQYGALRELMLEIAPELRQQLGIQTTDIQDWYTSIFDHPQSGVKDVTDHYNERRLSEVANETIKAISNPNVHLSKEVIDKLVKRGVLQLKPGQTTSPTDTDEQYENKFEENPKFRAGFSVQGLAQGGCVVEFGPSSGIFDTLEQAVKHALTVARGFFAEYASDVGQVFGSTLGRHIARHESPGVQIAASTLLGTVGMNLGEALEDWLNGVTTTIDVGESFENFGEDITGAGIGAISSFLTAELFEDLGLEGTLADLGQSIFAAELSAVITGLTSSTVTVAQALRAVNVGNLIGGFIGTKLAAELVEFDTVAGQIGAAIGTAIGATVGANIGLKAGTFLGGPIGAAIGAFVGYILGGLIGTLFGKTPKSGADLGWDQSEQKFAVTNVWARGGAPKDGARSLGTNVAELLNSVIAMSGARLLEGSEIRAGSYGTFKKDFVYRTTDASGKEIVALRTRQANMVINYGAAIAIADMIPRLAGGDIFAKRAIASTLAMSEIAAATMPAPGASVAEHIAALMVATHFDVNVLLGNVSTAKDYGGYLASRDSIDVLMAAEPTSAFTAGWTITLARAIELGLTRRGETDWIGGWNVFLDTVPDGALDGNALSGASVGFAMNEDTLERLFGFTDGEGNVINVLGDTINSAGKDRINGTDAADTITVSDHSIANASGLTINGAAGTSAGHVIDIAATMYGGTGNDVISGGDYGNDLLGGAGNDTLVGGKLDDWLIGGEGDDRLFAGAANHQFTDGNVAATNAALNVRSNGDMLDGGAGNDLLYGSRGSDYLIGGDGADHLFGGAGGDILAGGRGDDRGANGEARLLGGSGTDQYVFGFGDGIDVVFDESDPSATPGAVGDSIYQRLQLLNTGTLQRNWAGGGDYEIDGSVKGGEDAIAFGPGITLENIFFRRSGTAGAPGQDLILQLMVEDQNGERVATGDQIVIRDWYDSTRRVEWLRLADGEDIRIGDIGSFVVGSASNDVIIGTAGGDFLYGSAGDDVMFGLQGDDFGFGGRGRDLVAGDDDNDLVSGGSDTDKVIGGAGNDTVFGDDGNDSVYGGSGSDLVAGGLGDDTVIGGAGDDIFRYQRGDGHDILLDDLVNNWELVWQNGTFVNGYVLSPEGGGTVTKNGVVYFDGTHWNSDEYDYDHPTLTFRRHLGTVGGSLVANAGTDFLEFGVGIDIQDLMLRRNGSDLEVAVTKGDSDATPFDSQADRITLRDWYVAGGGPTIENFVFVATGTHNLVSWNITGLGTDAANNIVGTVGMDWITGNGGDDIISGDAGADVLAGNSGADTLSGGADNDVLYGGGGDDVLEGGAGADTLIGGSGTDIASYANASTTAMRAFLNAPATNSREGVGDSYVGIEGLEGTAGADRLGGDENGNILRGLAGNDTLLGGGGDDVYEFNALGNQDTIIDSPFSTEVILNTAGELNTAQYVATWTYLGFIPTPNNGTRHCYRLVVTSLANGEEVYRSRDTIDFTYTTGATRTMPATGWPASNAQWIGGAARTNNGNQIAREIFVAAPGGNDTLDFGMNISLSDLSFQRLNGGADLRVIYSGTSHHVTITGQNDANRAIETLQLRDGLSASLTQLVLVGETAGTGDDLVVGDANANTLSGLDGDDVLSGAAGNDTLQGGEGDDTLEGGAGSDALDGGNDSLTAGLAIDQADQTGARGDTIRYVRSTAAVTIDLAARTASGGHASGDTIALGSGGFASIENVVGSDGFNDTLRGDARDNHLAGLGGDDLLEGRAGNDLLLGGLGNDTVRGGDGEDNIAGEDGNDTIEGGNAKDLVAGNDGNDFLYGDAGDDMVSGGLGIDELHGGADNDQLGGDADNDTLYGDAGDDMLAGGTGNDTLFGGDGSDALAGQEGDDQLQGGAGDDTYVFDALSGAETVIDSQGTNSVAILEATQEQIWLSRVGNDLRIGLIGSTASMTLSGYYAAGGTRVREILLSSHSLFLAHAEPLITAMTAASAGTPASMPEAIGALASRYWHEGGKPAPIAADQQYTTDDLTSFDGTVGAVDHDENITSYAVSLDPEFGTVVLNPTTGAWTYTPNGVDSGVDIFTIEVTDADNNSTVQTITVNVTPTEPALPPLINVAQVALPQAPLTKVTLDSGSWAVNIEGQLADTDRSEDLDVRVSGVPAGITFNAGTNLGGGVWSFGDGPWPTLMLGPANWSQDLTLVVTASSREISNGRVAWATPVTLNIEVNARPTNVVPVQALSFNENTASGTVLTSLAATDGDAGDTATFQLVNNAGGRFTLDSNGTLRAGSTGMNFEAASSHVIRVRVTDTGGLTFERDLTVTVQNVNEVPVVTNQVLGTSEDTAFGGSVAATDPDGNIASYAVATAATRGAVALNTSTGTWTYTPTANLYGADSFQVRVTDAGGLSTVQTVTVNVTSVNDAPSAIALTGAPASINENDRPITGTVAAPVVLGTLSATDVDAPDAGDFATHVFTVSDSRFEVVSGNVLRLRAGSVLDFETATSVTFNVTVRDRNGAASGLTFTRSFTFNVADRDDYFYGGTGNDTITGTAGRNLIYGQGGNDTLTGAGVVDTIDGGDGADQLFGLAGADTLTGGLGDDVIEGGTGNDTASGGDGVDTLRGGDGNDTLAGDAGADLLQGGLNDDQLDGGADNDRLEGGDGNDRLVGGGGDDLLIGGLGADRFLGGAGVDTVSYENATAGVIVNLATLTGSGGEAAGDIFEDLPERLIGSGHADSITGSTGDDYIDGGAGDDTLLGGAGNDWLVGGLGNDTIDAQAGNDTLEGGAGNDILIGGDDSDTYLMDINSGVDEIRNFDPSGMDIDVVGYANITNGQLWFEKVGNDLVVSVVGTPVRTTIKDWYVGTTATERSNYKIDFFIASDHSSRTIDAEALVTLMAGYTRPTTQAQYDALLATPSFQTQWNTAWRLNAPPVVPAITSQTINEDGTLSLGLTITDDLTLPNGLAVVVTAVRTDNYGVEDLSLVNAPSISAPDVNGARTLTVTTKPNVSGQVAIKVVATDAGGLFTERVFLLTVNAVADTPVLSVVQAVTPTAPLTRPTLDGGSWGLNLQASLVDQDGSETLEVRIANVPTGITFNAGTDLGSGVWRFTPAQLTGLMILGPATWSQDLSLSVTAISRETSTGLTATSAATPLTIVINARPTDIGAPLLSFAENTASGTALTTLTRTDADAGDTATYTLVNNAGGRFSLDSNGTLRATSTALNFEAATSHTIRVRVTDSGGLTFERDFTVAVTNVNEAPTDIAPPASLQIAENSAAGTVIGAFTRTDIDAGDTATYSLTNNAGSRFTIDSNGTLRVGATGLNFEAATSHTIRVRVTDAGGLTYEEDFTVGVTNVNEAPTDISYGTLQVFEDVAPNTIVGTLSRADVDAGDTATYTMVNSAGGRFRVDANGTLRTDTTGFNFEAATSHTIRVRVADAGGLTYEEDITIGVLNRNEAPTDLIPDAALSVNENIAPGTHIAYFSRTDQDAGDSAVYSIYNDGSTLWDAGGRVTITPTGDLRIGSFAPNYESGGGSFTIRVQVLDSGGLSYVEAFAFNVVNLNEAPYNLRADRTLSFAENASGGLAWIVADDPEGNIASYAIVGGAGAPYFSLASNGLLSSGGTPFDHETAPNPTIRVRVTDTNGLAQELDFAVTITNVNEAPVINSSAFTVYEGSYGPPGSQLRQTSNLAATLSTTDPENNPVTYQVLQVGDAAPGGLAYNVYGVDSSGTITVWAPLDYEASSRKYHDITIRATDSLGASSDRTVRINLVNQNEAPTISFTHYDPGDKPFDGTFHWWYGNYWRTSWELAGWANVADPDGDSVSLSITSLIYQVASGTTLPNVTFSWVAASSPSTYAQIWNGNELRVNAIPAYSWYDQWISTGYTEARADITVRVTDPGGLWNFVTVSMLFHTELYAYFPVVLDLDGNGIDLLPLMDSAVPFDLDADGTLDYSGWIRRGDAFLALDRNGDGVINDGSEISFINDTPGATSDLEGLRSYDTNGNGAFDNGDERFAEFVVWEDANQDGVSQGEELRTLADHDITSISLQRELTGESLATTKDNAIIATSEFARGDGTIGTVGDVTLAYVAQHVRDVEVQPAGQPASVPEIAPNDLDAVQEALDFPPADTDTSIGEVDRSARGDAPPVPVRHEVGGVFENTGERDFAQSEQRAEVQPEATRSVPASNASEKRAAEGPAYKPEPRRIRAGEEWESELRVPQVRSALHASLDSVARRRLQMIDAMAGFSAEGSSMLALQPQRRVDAQTLELLTAVPGVRSLA